MELTIKKIDRASKLELPKDLIFGAMFADHMFEMDYSPDKGWHNATIKKFENLSLHPAAMVLHYGQEIFEGMKAYRHADGKIALFRPEKNFERMNVSAKRLCMPEFDVPFMVEALKKLVDIDRDWVPKEEGQSLYIRPFMIATDPYVGVRASDTYKLLIIASPVGLYYPQGLKPVPILVADQYVRAVKKGVGFTKCGGNYAAGMIAQKEAKEKGYTQVLWLDAIENKYIEEVGTMNLFVQFENEVATPELAGSILAGVTRMSTIEVLKDWGYKVNERNISIEELYESFENGTLKEIFGTGTAATISCVGKLEYKGKILDTTNGVTGDLSRRLYDHITGIQFGKVEDKFNWLSFID